MDTDLAKSIAQASLQKHIAELYETGEYADLTIQLGNLTCDVHRSILCGHSEFFKKACEGEWKEVQNREIKLHDHEWHEVDEMLKFLHTCDYNDSVDQWVHPLTFNVRMVAISEKYFIRHLATAASAKFANGVKDSWSTPHFTDAVSVAYDYLSDIHGELHSAITAVVMEHATELLDKTEECGQSFLDLMKQIPRLAVQVAQAAVAVANQLPEDERQLYICPGCATYLLASVHESQKSDFYNCPVDGCGGRFTCDK